MNRFHFKQSVFSPSLSCVSGDSILKSTLYTDDSETNNLPMRDGELHSLSPSPMI